jgi:lambda repressor-like predicted transcriptional regulator
VLLAYESGDEMASLAREYGANRTSISALLRKAGVEIREAPRISQIEIDQAVQLYEDGLSLERIGERLGWDHNTIYRHLKKRGVAMRVASDWKY